jgi:RND family efflux transporter MFP subunit
VSGAKVYRGGAVIALALAVLVVALALTACGAGEHASGQRYHCPMHPTYISDTPGDCPICGMRLVPIDEAGDRGPGTGPRKASPAAADRPTAHGPRPTPLDRKVLFYRNPMDPTVTSPAPMKDPMGMDYVPVYADEQTGATGAVPGLARVEMTPEGLRLSGVQTAPVERGSLARTVRTVGAVVPDETRVDHFHTRVTGWVEKLYVNFTGQYVEHGQPVLSIYSPQLLASQQEYLRARESAAGFAASEIPEVRKGGADLVAAARRRLELLDVPADLIAEIERTGIPQRDVTLVAHTSGYVTAKGIFPGQQVDPSMMELFTITDLSRVWVEADFYQYEASLLRLGQEARVTLPYDAARELSGRVAYIYPTLTPDSRTLRVRFELANPKLDLKPGMFADVEIRLGEGDGLMVPDSAVMDTGERQVVFVQKGGGVFEPREVKAGARSGGKVQVLSGLVEGERVVIRANFLLDSESRLRALFSAGGTAFPPSHPSSPLPPEPPPLAPGDPSLASTPPPATRPTGNAK